MQRSNRAPIAALLRALPELAEAIRKRGQRLLACDPEHLEVALRLRGHSQQRACGALPAELRPGKGSHPSQQQGEVTVDPARFLLDIHGGPHSFHGNNFSAGYFYRYVMPASGWGILLVNPTGSGSYGKAFAHGIRARWGEHDLPEQMAKALKMAGGWNVPVNEFPDIHNVVAVGMGGSAIGGDIARSLLAPELVIPFHVCRNYVLPEYVDDETLVIVSSYSGNTNEILWGAKFATRCPWITCVLRLSSYECGMDQPTFTPVQKIVEASGTLLFKFGDLDATRPAGSIVRSSPRRPLFSFPPYNRARRKCSSASLIVPFRPSRRRSLKMAGS